MKKNIWISSYLYKPWDFHYIIPESEISLIMKRIRTGLCTVKSQ